MKKVLITLAVLGLTATAHAHTLDTFKYDGGKKAEVYVGSSKYVYVRTPVAVYDTGYQQSNSTDSDCAYKRYGKCISQSAMLSDIKNKTESGSYWK